MHKEDTHDGPREDCSDVEQIAKQYTESELRQLCVDYGFRVDRSWNKGALIDLLLNPDRYPQTVNAFDELRDKMCNHVNEHRNQLAGMIACPLADDERGCYSCSDAMIMACWLVNESKLGGNKK